MKILFIITGLGMGGAEHVVINLADALSNRNHEVQIVFLTGELLVRPKNSNIKVTSLNLDKPLHFFKSYLKLTHIVRAMKPDVIHSHMFHANILARLLRLTTPLPRLICSSHSTNEGGRIRMLAYRFTDKLADISTNVSQEAVDALVKKRAFSPSRIVKVVNGIDTESFKFNSNARAKLRKELGLTDDMKMILAVGRLYHPKDYPNLFYAIKRLLEKRNDFKLFIAGDGPLKSELLQLSKELKIDNYIEFLGVRRDIPHLMCACDTFVLSSAWEGFGLVVAEAMACERVVVATDCGGVNEVLGNQGFLVPPRNSQVLSQVLHNSLDIPDKKRTLIGINAREHILNNFSLKANVDNYLDLYYK